MISYVIKRAQLYDFVTIIQAITSAVMARGRRGAKSGNTRKLPASGDVPDVYREMLAVAVSSSTTQRSEEGRPVKRRRVGGRIVTQGNEGTSSHQSDDSSRVADTSDFDDLFEDVGPHRQQVAQTDSEDSAASDMDWEEVEIRDREKQEDTPEPEDADSGQLNLVLGGGGSEHDVPFHGIVKRKPMTVEDKRLRLEIHKIYLCSLLAHVHLRNHWCNNIDVHVCIQPFCLSISHVLKMSFLDHYEKAFDEEEHFLPQPRREQVTISAISIVHGWSDAS